MNGKRLLFDTNAIVSLLQGNNKLLKLSHRAEWIGLSVISMIEFLSYPNLSSQDKKLFNKFISRVHVVSLDSTDKKLIDNIIKIRKKYKIKLPDAIIVSTAVKNNAILVTADKQLSKITEVRIII